MKGVVSAFKHKGAEPTGLQIMLTIVKELRAKQTTTAPAKILKKCNTHRKGNKQQFKL